MTTTSSKSNTSPVWEYFTVDDKDPTKAKCKKCKSVISRAKGSTSGMKKHLKTNHKIELKEKSEPEEKKPRLEQKKISTFLGEKKKETVQTIVSKLAATDGLSLHRIVKSEFIRDAVNAKGLKLPKSHNTVKKHIINECKEKKDKLKENVTEMRKNGTRYGITLDEWTSIRNRRYLNITLHTKQECWDLGLSRCIGSITSPRTIELVRQKLNRFDLEFNEAKRCDIISSTADGASVMVSFGERIRENHMSCYAHAIHLAVQDVFYKKGGLQGDEETQEDESDEEDNEGEMLEELSDAENETEDGDDTYEDIDDDEDEVPSFKDVNVSKVITKVRKLVVKIRRSPLKNDRLQKYIREKHEKELVLIRDNKTRWNSCVDMIERFLTVRDCINKVMIDYPEIKVEFSEDEISILEGMVEALKPVKMAVVKLSDRKTDLLRADKIFLFLLKTLSQSKGKLAKLMFNAIQRRFAERRPSKLLDAYQYLHNPDSLKNTHQFEVFKMGSKASIKETITKLYDLLHADADSGENEDLNDESNAQAGLDNQEEEQGASDVEIEEEKSEYAKMYAELEREINMVEDEAANPEQSAAAKSIAMDFRTWENTKIRPKRLELIYQNLGSVKPTSVESERAFSACSQILTKIRSRMGDDLLDALTFLRHWYKHNKDD